MTSLSRGPVVVDTNVFGARLRDKTQDLADRYEPVLVGRGLVVSFQTVMELEYGAMVANWGATRQRRLARLINDARVVWAGRDLTRRCAVLAPSAVVLVTRWHSAATTLTSGSPQQRCGWICPSSPRTASSTAFQACGANDPDGLSVLSVVLRSLAQDERVVVRLIPAQ